MWEESLQCEDGMVFHDSGQVVDEDNMKKVHGPQI